MHKVFYGEETQLPIIIGGKFLKKFWMGYLITLLPPLLSAEHNLVLDMKIIMKSMENLRVRRE